eukprot:5698-Heterococcus_DN1.PRE.1
MELGLSLVDNRSNSHNSDSQHDEQHDNIASKMRKRQHNENLHIAHPDTVEVVLLSCFRFDMEQLALTKGPVERRLMRMKQKSQGLFSSSNNHKRTEATTLKLSLISNAFTFSKYHHYFLHKQHGNSKNAEYGDDDNGIELNEGLESLALIGWYREGQKKCLIQSILAASLTTQYRLHFSFGQPLYWEHPLRNPFNHEERFKIDLNDTRLRVIISTEEWKHYRRHVEPCIGQIGNTPIESELFDVTSDQGVQITLMAGEVMYIPFVYQDFEPLRGEQQDSITKYKQQRNSSNNHNNSSTAPSSTVTQTAAPDISSVVSFISASHGHVVSAVQVHAYRKPYVIDRTFRFYQPEGDILKRAIQLLPVYRITLGIRYRLFQVVSSDRP